MSAASKRPTLGGFGPASDPETWDSFSAEPEDFGPRDGVAVLCGPCPAGEALDDRWLLCLDLDGGLTRTSAGAALGCRLPRTLSTHDRAHLWYWVPPSDARAALRQWNGLLGARKGWAGEGKAPDVDVKWCGGYARELGEPATFDVGKIVDLPAECLEAILAAPGAGRAEAEAGRAALPEPGELALADVAELTEALVAAWPAAGAGVHDAAKALGGALRRLGAPRAQTRALAREVLAGAGSDALATRVAAAVNAWDRADAGSTAYGRPTLARLLGEGGVAAMAILDRLTPEAPVPAGMRDWYERYVARADAKRSPDPRKANAATLAATSLPDPTKLQLTGPNLDQPWIVQYNTTYWMWLRGEQAYSPAIPHAALEASVARDMPVDEDRRAMPDLRTEWIQPAWELRASYTARAHRYLPETRTLELAALRWTERSAKRHAHIDRWLRALFGEAYPAAAQWLASLFCLERPAPCLYLHGPKSVGKTLLACGLASIWSRGAPVEMSEAISNFNAATGSCPLIFTDEGFPERMSFDVFRNMVTAHERRVNEKNRPQYDVIGCARLMIAANSDNLLRYQRTGSLTRADIEAIADRLLVIKCLPEAAERLDFNTSAAARTEIAEHVAWLAETVALQPKGRMAAAPGGADTLLTTIVAGRNAPALRYIQEQLSSERRVWSSGVFTPPKAPKEVWISVPIVLERLHQSTDRAAQAVTNADLRALAQTLGMRPEAEQRKIKGTNYVIRALSRDQIDCAVAQLD